MSVIRTPPMIVPPGPTPAAIRPQAVRAAFFAQAAGQPVALSEPTPAPRAASPLQSQTQAQPGAPDPDRPLRPGALLDIRV